jgi:hypothetical protein
LLKTLQQTVAKSSYHRLATALSQNTHIAGAISHGIVIKLQQKKEKDDNFLLAKSAYKETKA